MTKERHMLNNKHVRDIEIRAIAYITQWQFISAH